MSADRVIAQQSERTASRVIDGRAVVIVIDRQKIHTLNEVGARIWELADGRTVDEIADAITREFAVERGVALADTRRFLEHLRELGAIELTGAPA